MLDFAILGLLMEHPRHGYELRRALGELGFWKVSFGSLYPAMRLLEKRCAIKATRGTGRRKVYEITTSGREVFEALIQSDPEAEETDRSFHVRLAFLDHLPSERRIQVLGHRRTELSHRIRTTRGILIEARSARRNGDRYQLALMEHARRSAEADIAWLDELVATERSSASTFR